MSMTTTIQPGMTRARLAVMLSVVTGAITLYSGFTGGWHSALSAIIVGGLCTVVFPLAMGRSR
jgi:hypothetical protein